jgi:hypothetical protein
MKQRWKEKKNRKTGPTGFKNTEKESCFQDKCMRIFVAKYYFDMDIHKLLGNHKSIKIKVSFGFCAC